MCAALHAWPSAASRDEEAVPYVRQVVERWPSRQRVAQDWMVQEAFLGHADCLRLCKIAEIPSKRLSGTLERLIKEGHLTHIEQVWMCPGRTKQEELMWLMASEMLPALEVLRLDAQGLRDKDLKMLEDAKHAPPLRELSLTENQLHQDAALSLAVWRGAAQLESLALDHQDWAPRTHGGRFVMPNLRQLSLRGNTSARCLEWLLETSCLAQLDALCIPINATRVEALARLLAHPVATKLEELRCELDTTGWDFEDQGPMQQLLALGARWPDNTTSTSARGALSPGVYKALDELLAQISQAFDESAYYRDMQE